MAKWGEGDPRWLVEERPDAKNVNNWHWTETNASHWSKEKLRKILDGTKVETDFAQCRITEITKCEGDAVVNNRKAKLIFFYEWAIEMKWEGILVNGDTNIKGTMKIPYLSEEYDMKDVDINVHLESSGPEAEILKDMMINTGGEVIRHQLSQYVTTLKEEFSKGLILPTKDSSDPEDLKCDKVIKKTNDFGTCIVMPDVSKKFGDTTVSASNQKFKLDDNCTIIAHVTKKFREITDDASNQTFEVGDIIIMETFKCTAVEFYRAMTEYKFVKAFTHGNCVLESEEGGNFELFDGAVQGTFVNLVPNKTIKQKWRLNTWPPGHFSDVIIDIYQKEDCTKVQLMQKGIPKNEIGSTCSGWKRNYWDSMKRTLGFGALRL